MRRVKLLFRKKRESRRAIKVFTNVRVKGSRTPRQIHLGYVQEHVGLTSNNRKRIDGFIRQKWLDLFGDAVSIDWDDAERKWHQKFQPKRSPPSSSSSPFGGDGSSGQSSRQVSVENDNRPVATNSADTVRERGLRSPREQREHELGQNILRWLSTGHRSYLDPVIVHTCRRLPGQIAGLRPDIDALDLLHEAWYRLMVGQSLHFEPHEAPIAVYRKTCAWLRRVAQNLAIDISRRPQARPLSDASESVCELGFEYTDLRFLAAPLHRWTLRLTHTEPPVTPTMARYFRSWIDTGFSGDAETVRQQLRLKRSTAAKQRSRAFRVAIDLLVQELRRECEVLQERGVRSYLYINSLVEFIETKMQVEPRHQMKELDSLFQTITDLVRSGGESGVR